MRGTLKEMKKRRAAVCFLMVFIMSFTLLPSGVFAAQNDSVRARKQIAGQSRKFDADKEKQEKSLAEEAENSSEKASAENTKKTEADALRLPELSEAELSEPEGTVIKRMKTAPHTRLGKTAMLRGSAASRFCIRMKRAGKKRSTTP